MQMYIREYMMTIMVKYVVDNEERPGDNVKAAQPILGGGAVDSRAH